MNTKLLGALGCVLLLIGLALPFVQLQRFGGDVLPLFFGVLTLGSGCALLGFVATRA